MLVVRSMKRTMSLKLPRNWDFSTLKAETSARIARSKSVMPAEGSPGSGSPGSPGSLERPLKAGWLKKQQRNIVKNWHQRYFVLRGSTLTYHKDDKETTVQGIIPLKFSKVSELPPNTDDPGKYLFEIIPRSHGDRVRSPYVFMASSQTDMDEWVRTLRRAIGVQTSHVFGKGLADTVTYERRFGPHMVPILVQKCAEFIREHGLNEEGIFRLPGQENTVKQFRDAFDAGERPSFPSDTDVHAVASLLKLYLRELPEPVVPWTQYQDCLDCTHRLNPERATGLELLEKQIALLPRINYNLLSYICRFLYEVQQNSSVNKMSVENLATVMGINLLKPQIEDPITMMKATPQIQKLMTTLIRQHQALFPPAKDVLPSTPTRKKKKKKSSAPRSFVGWESTAEPCDASLSESAEDEDDNDSPEPEAADSNSSAIPQDPLSAPSSDPWSSVSSRKRTQTLPSFNCPTTGIVAKVEALNRWSRIQESIEEKNETFSEDIFKILDLQRSSLFGGPSLKTTAKEGKDRCMVRRGSDVTASCAEGLPEAVVDTAVSTETQSHEQPTETLTVNTSASQLNSEAENHEDSQEHTQHLINSLQQKNTELTATVAELRSALESEHRQRAALEVRLRNAERSRDEAQNRNRELDKEIQAFLTREPRAPS